MAAKHDLTLHELVNRSVAPGGKNHGGCEIAVKLVLMLTLVVVGSHCHSSCDAAREINMPETVLSDHPGLASLKPAALEQVFEVIGDQVLRLELFRRDNPSLSPSLADSRSKNTALPKTLAKRFVEAVKRSNVRRDAIANSMQAVRDRLCRSSKPSSIPVSAGNGDYLTQLALGTPKQSFIAIVDTGSDLVWTQCLPCQECQPQTGPIFNPANSSTYKPVKCGPNLCQDLEILACPAAGCEYVYAYGGGDSTTGNFAMDTVTLGSASVPNLGFGCGHDNMGYFLSAGGIVGLGQGPLSLVSQLSKAGVISKRFSYCLVDYGSDLTSPLIFGDPAVTSAPPGVAYSPIQANPNFPTFYYLNLIGISVAGKALSYPPGTFAIDSSGNGGVILDSGTTLTYLATAGYDAVLAAVKADLIYPTVSGSPYGLDLCFNIGGATTLQLPGMVFHFQNADFILKTVNLYVLVDTTGPIVCLAMAGNSGFSIFGNIQQQDHLLVYDLVKFQIGFKSITCGS